MNFTDHYFKQNSGGASTAKAIVSVEVDYTGSRLVASPRFSWSGDTSYDLWLGEEKGTLTPGFSWAFKTLSFFDPSEGRDRSGSATYRRDWAGNTFLGQPSYWLMNARLAYTPKDEGMQIIAWVRNLTDTRYSFDAFSDLEGSKRTLRVMGEPRTFGLTLWVGF